MAGGKDHFAAATGRLSSFPPRLVVTCDGGSAAAAAQQASYGVGGAGGYGSDGVGVGLAARSLAVGLGHRRPAACLPGGGPAAQWCFTTMAASAAARG